MHFESRSARSPLLAGSVHPAGERAEVREEIGAHLREARAEAIAGGTDEPAAVAGAAFRGYILGISLIATVLSAIGVVLAHHLPGRDHRHLEAVRPGLVHGRARRVRDLVVSLGGTNTTFGGSALDWIAAP